MKYIKQGLTVLAFLMTLAIGTQVIKNAKINQQYKKDSAEINHFKYGLFSVDSWKYQLSNIISDEIDKLYLTRKNERTLKGHLEDQLEILIDKINDRIKKKNIKTANGRFKQSLMDSFVDVKEIKEGIPEYAQAILAEMSAPKTENQIKGLIKNKISSYLKTTFDVRPNSQRDLILAKYGSAENLTKKILIKHYVISEQAMFMVMLAIFIFILEAFTKGPLLPFQYVILTLTLLTLLAVGVTTPMIDMEAKISHLSFMLFDHPIHFQNQILYFQSKSILDVFRIMISHKDIQMKLVGILMVSFSVVFPLLKITSSLAYYYDYCQARKFRLIQFFVFKSGKWSMADVLVVAIFMAYIGFNGIINSQLGNLSAFAGEELEVMTTNGTSLQPGFYLFFCYTILAMLLAGFLKSRLADCKKS